MNLTKGRSLIKLMEGSSGGALIELDAREMKSRGTEGRLTDNSREVLMKKGSKEVG